MSRSAVGSLANTVSQAFASADLTTGTLRGSSFGGLTADISFPPLILASSTSILTDTITLHGAGTSVLVDMTMDVDGFFTLIGNIGASSATASASFTLGGDGANLSLTRAFNSGIGLDVLNGSVGGSAGTFLDKTLNSAQAHLVYEALLPLNTPLNLESFLTTTVSPFGPTIGADFSNTAQLALALPDGYTFTSASGHFLSPAVSPVPEPDTLALLLAGMATIGAVSRRRLGLSGRARAPALRGAAPAPTASA